MLLAEYIYIVKNIINSAIALVLAKYGPVSLKGQPVLIMTLCPQALESNVTDPLLASSEMNF